MSQKAFALSQKAFAMSQKALLLESAPNGPWKVGTKSIPKPAAGELLVKIQAAALNPADWKIRAYNVLVKEWPAVLGVDAAGVVEELGEGVTTFAKGDKIVFRGQYTNDKATFQQYSLAVAELSAKLPSNISFESAASIPAGLATAAAGLYAAREDPGARKLTPPWETGKGQYNGQPIVVFGGSSSVGQYTIQLAKLSGFSPIITTASLHNEALVKSLGATHIVGRKSDVVAEVKKILSNPVDVIFDSIADKDTQEQAWEILAPGGTLLIVQSPLVDKAKYSDKHVEPVFGNFFVPGKRALGVSLYSKLTQLFAEGLLKPNDVEVLPNGLAGIPDGLQRLQDNKISGTKLIALPQETA